ncbi:MAG: capsule biosynthesis GfcC family protein, partial [Pseudomonadales bacterium]|nr:capsule biosynthesis GfcC family protein [Pseudomonadales bacterium]
EVPLRPRQVTVMGQVYVPTSHRWEKNRSIRDYIELSGGETVLGREQDAYAVLANGEVVSIRRGLRGGSRFHNQKPEPGAMIYVPLDVDRMNTTERIQAWTRSIFEVAVLAGIVL